MDEFMGSLILGLLVISAVTAETLLNSDGSCGTVGGFSDSDIPDL